MSSSHWFERAKAVIPGGVNSPVRAFNGVGGTPSISPPEKEPSYKPKTTRINRLLWILGTLILGHAREEVIETVKITAEKGMTFGANTRLKPNLLNCFVIKFLRWIWFDSSIRAPKPL